MMHPSLMHEGAGEAVQLKSTYLIFVISFSNKQFILKLEQLWYKKYLPIFIFVVVHGIIMIM